MSKRDIEDRILNMGEAINDLEDELQFVRSKVEAKRIQKAIDTIQDRIDKLAKKHNIDMNPRDMSLLLDD
tara:strand:+ start:4469 stop:4678 length:210 start_codon:yes stop_codon:yes gene_type:complete